MSAARILIECKVCHGMWPEVAFRRNSTLRIGHTRVTNYRRRVCRICWVTIETERKKKNRALDKARKSEARHAKSAGMELKEFRAKARWDLQQIAEQLDALFESGCCQDCKEPFSSMPNGWGGMTIDVRDPRAFAYYTNIEINCSTCNSIKQRMTPNEWGEYCVYRQKWRERQAMLKRYPDALIGPLFDFCDDEL